MKIAGIRLRDLSFSREPVTLAQHTVSPTSALEEHCSRGWFGPVVWTLVEVFDDDGHVGLGTAGAFHGAGKEMVARYYADLVLGDDPRRHDALWQRMYRANVRFGRSGTGMCALSALDIACWDLHGRATGAPVVDLLGGRTRHEIPLYASRLYAVADRDALAEEARGYRAGGFTAVKTRIPFSPRDGAKGMRGNAAHIATVREAVGPDIDVAVEAYMGWDSSYTVQMAARLQEFDLWWLEEPLMPHELDGYADLRSRLPWLRISCGEHLYGKWEFAQLARRNAVDVWQPDGNRVGGITELRKICALAEAFGVQVIPHSNEAHNLHVLFSQPTHVCPISEYFPPVEPDTGNELFWKVFSGNPIARNGNLHLGQAPGLGLTVDEDAVGRLQHGDTIVVGSVPEGR